MQITDQAKDLVKSCFEGRPLCVPFTTESPTSWVLNKLTKSRKFTCDDLCGKARVVDRE